MNNVTKKNCNLEALAITNDKAKRSCYLFHKTVFEKQTLKNGDRGSFFISLVRYKCNDVVKYIFTENTLSTRFDKFEHNQVPVNDDQCEDLKVVHNRGEIMKSELNIPQIDFEGCRTLTLRLDD